MTDMVTFADYVSARDQRIDAYYAWQQLENRSLLLLDEYNSFESKTKISVVDWSRNRKMADLKREEYLKLVDEISKARLLFEKLQCAENHIVSELRFQGVSFEIC